MIQIDMDKPKNCWECPFAVDSGRIKGFTCAASYREDVGFMHFHTPEEAMWLYLKKCPLIEVKNENN